MSEIPSMQNITLAAAWLAERACEARIGRLPVAAGPSEDLEQFRCAACRAECPDAPMAERFSECADCQRNMLLGADAAK